MGRDMVRYHRVDAGQRTERQDAWNRPILWPMALAGAALALALWLARRSWLRRERQVALHTEGRP
jgi:hypothetical protein